MSNISLKNFVDVNITRKKQSAIASTRDTVAILTDCDMPNEYTYDAIYTIDNVLTFSNHLDDFLSTYFNNGGQKAHVYFAQNLTSPASLIIQIRNLPTEEIVVMFAKTKSPYSQINYVASKVAQAARNDSGIDSKLILSGLAATGEISTLISDTSGNILEASVIPRLIWKYCMGNTSDTATYWDVATIAAYLSKLDMSKIDSVYDYCYTDEVLLQPQGWQLTDADFKLLQQKNINVDIQLAGALRNIGGNCLDGSDIVNVYCSIVLQQTLTERLVDLLSTKIKGADGIAKIYSTAVKELNKYVTCGYLSTDKVWTNPDLTINYNGKIYTLIKQGTALLNGYSLTILPMTSLTEDDLILHKAPPIYLILAEQYGIRVIEINGEVI